MSSATPSRRRNPFFQRQAHVETPASSPAPTAKIGEVGPDSGPAPTGRGLRKRRGTSEQGPKMGAGTLERGRKCSLRRRPGLNTGTSLRKRAFGGAGRDAPASSPCSAVPSSPSVMLIRSAKHAPIILLTPSASNSPYTPPLAPPRPAPAKNAATASSQRQARPRFVYQSRAATSLLRRRPSTNIHGVSPTPKRRGFFRGTVDVFLNLSANAMVGGLKGRSAAAGKWRGADEQ